MIWFLIQKKIRYVIFLNNGEVPSIEWEAVLKTVGDKTFAGAKPVLSENNVQIYRQDLN